MSSFAAFVDAVAGSSGSLFATASLYPLDVLKIRQQADVSSTKQDTFQKNNVKKNSSSMSILNMGKDIISQKGFVGLYIGFPIKAIQTFVSNFTFFYCLTYLKTVYLYHKKTKIQLSTGESLLLNSIAAAINMSFTLPLDLITTKIQTQKGNDETSLFEMIMHIYSQEGLLAFWKGYFASLVLVSNPAINYTIFDKMKASILSKRTSNGVLSMGEAFCLGACAKCIATICTYPIIRAKVLMQAQEKKTVDEPSSLCQVLLSIGKRDGISGYFKGMSAQLINTVLKSALLLMTKEQITVYTMRVLYAMKRKKAAALMTQ